ncbi:MAG TPA: hypothetical protein VHK01_13595 [Lacipirellulaceae bacterium]|jgi:hypothetical protein|nr:hypothetical protein [Lacipirellulaceae bacterium]
MRSAVVALAWEFWAANRRGWLIVLGAVLGCALLYRVFAGPLQESEDLRFLCCLPMVMSLILAAAFCNFTDRNSRDGIAGFPRHLFVLPLQTRFLVTWAMAFGLVSVLTIYIVWATLILPALGIKMWVRWPATLLAACVVCYQAIIWCLCSFRLTRIVTMSLVATTILGIGFLPGLLPKTNFWSSETVLTSTLVSLALIAYGATIVTVGVQRRGGGRGWTLALPFVDRFAAILTYRRRALKSPEAALFWIEWRRFGLVLPAAVLLTTTLILFLTIRFTDGSAKATMWAETWLGLMPVFLAVPIGMGFGKPDFWSLDLSLPTFVAARPISGGQLLAAKMKAAALSTTLAWLAVLLIAPLCIYLYLDTEHWRDAWEMSGILYSGFSRCILPILGLVMAMLLTWSLLIGSIWLGYSGRPGFYYSFVSVGTASLLTAMCFLVWWVEFPRSRDRFVVNALPWLPWLLATAISVKVWFAAAFAERLQLRGLISRRHVAVFLCVWIAATSFLVLRAWLLSPRIEWLRCTLLLMALCVIPAARLAATPLTIAWNRHR